jgi:hypothetical protein
MILLLTIAVVLASTLAASVALARSIKPARWTGDVRWLGCMAALLIAAAATGPVAAALLFDGLAPSAARRVFFVEADRVDRPTPEELASLRGAPLPPRCDSVRTSRRWEGIGSGIEEETTLRRCGPARFRVETGRTDFRPDREWSFERWAYDAWRCESQRTFYGERDGTDHGGSSERSRQLHARSSADGTFTEYTCPVVRCVECTNADCRPADPGCPTPPPLYVRQRDLRLPVTLSALGAVLVGLLAAALLRRSAAGVVPTDDPRAPAPYRGVPLPDDGRLARLMLHHERRLAAAVALLLALHAVGWIHLSRWIHLFP